MKKGATALDGEGPPRNLTSDEEKLLENEEALGENPVQGTEENEEEMMIERRLSAGTPHSPV